MEAVFSGISMLVSFLVLVFWVGDEWMWLFDLILQSVLFIILGKFVFSCAFLLSGIFDSLRPLIIGAAFMISVFLRWMVRLIFHFNMEATFPIVGVWHGIPYTLLCAVVVYAVLSFCLGREDRSLF